MKKYIKIETPVKQKEVTIIEKAFLEAIYRKHKKLDISKLTEEQRLARGCG